MHQFFKDVDTGILIDQLARQTNMYTQLLNEGRMTEAFEECRTMIIMIQEEIESRKTRSFAMAVDPSA